MAAQGHGALWLRSPGNPAPTPLLGCSLCPVPGEGSVTQSLELSPHFLSAHDTSSSFIFLLRGQRYRSPGCRGSAASACCCFTHTPRLSDNGSGQSSPEVGVWRLLPRSLPFLFLLPALAVVAFRGAGVGSLS